MANHSIIAVHKDNVLFMATRMYDDSTRPVAHKLKDGDQRTIENVAYEMAKCLPQSCVLVPVPGHNGYARQTLELAKMIGAYANVQVIDVLKGSERLPNYDAKKNGCPLTVEDMGIFLDGTLPTGKTAVVIDNVADTGTTAFACANAIGHCIVLTYAITDTLV